MSDFYQLDATEQSSRLTRLAKKALVEWGVKDCSPRLIKFRENAVFEVQDANGSPAALRVHRQGYHSDESLASELRWMKMLREAGMQVPAPIPASSVSADNTNFLVSVTSDDTPGVWQTDMLSWMDGRELGEVGVPLSLADYDTATVFNAIGQCMANLHNLSAQWSGTKTMQRHAWDHDGLVGDNPLWGQFWELSALDKNQRQLMLDIKAAVSEDLVAYGQTADNYGLIHADLVPENVMLCGTDIQLIDFDDAGFGWHMFEIATALHWLSDEPEFETIKSTMLQGYQKIRPLTQTDLDALRLFHVARSLTYLGWVHTRSQTTSAAELTPIMIDIASELGECYLADRL